LATFLSYHIPHYVASLQKIFIQNYNVQQVKCL
jgi:hypothetical protein